MMMLQCSAGHFTTNSSIVSCQKFDCILYYSTNFASVYLYPSCAVSTLKDEYTCYSRTIDFMRVVDWLFEKEQIQSHERKNYTITSSTRSI